MKRVQDKVILVTGAAMGMGKAHCELLAEQGARVYAADVDQAAGRAVAEGIRAAGGRAEFLALDVTRQGDWERAVATIVAQAGRIDVLVNNAGILILKPVQETTVADWDRIFDINAKGVFLGTQAVIAPMKAQGSGNIINISSIYGIVGAPSAAAYEATKGAVRLFTKACAVDLVSFGIRVNSVHPGVIETPMTRELLATEEGRTALLGATLLKRPAKPQEVSQAVLFLASDESSFVHGAELVVDGGYTCN